MVLYIYQKPSFDYMADLLRKSEEANQVCQMGSFPPIWYPSPPSSSELSLGLRLFSTMQDAWRSIIAKTYI